MSEKKKSGLFVRILKACLWLCVGLFAFVVLAVATLPLWISPVVTGVSGSMVPKYTGTNFRLERFYVNPWTGALRINGVKLSNPDGFGKYDAFSVGSVSVDVEIGELFSNRLHVRDVTVEGAFASYFSHDGKNNFDVIMANVKEALGGDEDKKDAAEVKEEPAGDSGEGMKVIIDHIRIAGTSVKIAESDIIPPLPVPTIELNDIGKESDGLKFDEVGKAISDAFMKAMGSMSDGLGALGGALGSGMDKLSKSAKDLGASAEESVKAVTGSVGDGAKSIVESVGKSAGSVTGSVGEGAKSAVGSIGAGAKATAEGVSEGAKSAVDAVGDTTKKAAEGMKKLFKGF